MQSIENAISLLRATPTCALRPPAGMPVLPNGSELPSDLKAFYSVAGGAELFRGADYQFSIVAPSDLISTNQRILGEASTGDISDSWFTVATDNNGEYLSIDLSATRQGRCYDSFHETHGLVGSTPVIATSFTNLLYRLIANRGTYPYWLAQGFANLGDAYDK